MSSERLIASIDRNRGLSLVIWRWQELESKTAVMNINFLDTLKYIILLFCFTLYSCSEEEVDYSNTTYCEYLETENKRSLSEIIDQDIADNHGKSGVYIIEEGDESMITRAFLCNAAEKSIDVQYFIFSSDNVGLIAADHLLRAAERDVKVRILVDDFMVEADEEDLLSLNAHKNIEVKIYNPNANIGKSTIDIARNVVHHFDEFNQRMHNKLFLVDDKVFVTGGRNVADEYFDYNREYNFRDRDILVLGEESKQAKSVFNSFWNDSICVNVSEVIDPSVEIDTTNFYKSLHEYACDPQNYWPQVRERMKLVPEAYSNIKSSGLLKWVDHIQFISDVPGKNKGDLGLEGGGISADSLAHLISNAKSEIYIQTPYLILNEDVMNLFKIKIDEGVKITVLTNSLASTDNLEAFNGYYNLRDTLLNIGVKIYEFKPDAAIRKEIMTSKLQEQLNYNPIFGLHAKSMVIDKETIVIGTFNLDPRSINLNTECFILLRDKEMASMLLETFNVDNQGENAWEISKSFNPDSVAGSFKEMKMKSRWFVPREVL